jgi:FkbM family methyltransferase
MKNDKFGLDGKSIKELVENADDLFRGDKDKKIKAHKIYQSILKKIPNLQDGDKPYLLRGIIRKRIWDCLKEIDHNLNYFSEAGQDMFIKENFFRNKKKGFFVEIGAYDGVQGSNCYYFEKHMDWQGIAIEASPLQFEKLKKNRNCKLINTAIGSDNNKVEFYEVTEGFTQMSGINNLNFKNSFERIKKNSNSKINKINIECKTFEKLIPSGQIIDLISIDIEGNEFDVLKSIDFKKYEIKVIVLENNIPNQLSYLKFFLEKNFSYFDRIGMDEIYYNQKYFNLEK